MEQGSYPFQAYDGAVGGGMARHWIDLTGTPVPPPSLRYSMDSFIKQSGNSSLRINCPKGYAQVGQVVKLIPGAAYAARIWVKSLYHGLIVSLGLQLGVEPYTVWGETTAALTTSWSKLDIQYLKIPESAPVADYHFIVRMGGVGRLWVDEASLQVATVMPMGGMVAANTNPIPKDYFCLNMNNIAGTPSWPAVDFALWRTWGSHNWATIQPESRDVFQWGALDADVAKAKARGQKVLFTLGPTPRWASLKPDEPSAFGPGMGSLVANITDWRVYVQALAQRYKGVIVAYEVWHEPNTGKGNSSYWNGTPVQLVRLARHTREVLAVEDPAAVLLSPPMANGGSLTAMQYLMDFLKGGGVAQVQGIAWHSYNIPVESDIASVTTLRSVMKQQRISNLSLWTTEAGVQDWVQLRQRGTPRTYSAGYLAKSYLLGWGLGVSSSCWHAYNNPTREGLTMSDAGTNRPEELNQAGMAYKTIMEWMVGAQMTTLTRNSLGVWMVQLQKTVDGAQKKSFVLWSSTGQIVAQRVESVWGVKYMQNLITGVNTTVKSGDTIQVQDTPVLLGQK